MIVKSLAILSLVAVSAATVAHVPPIGKPAPVFSARDTHGQPQSLEAYRGKWIVLEWFSHQCPYTAKQYVSGAMQRLQQTSTTKGVVWLSIVSSAPGMEGYTTDERANALTDAKHAVPSAVIRDTSGSIGRLYGATNTPNMFVIDPKGVLVYAGAIDDRRTADTADVARSHNFVAAALDEAMTGRPVAVPMTQPYGCVIPYAAR
jgi:peroxiredoxin